MLKHAFLPAIVPYTVMPESPGKEEEPHRGWRHPVHWLDEGPDFFPNVLCSYAHWRRQKNWHFSVDACEYIYGDSGGYSVVTRNEKVDPERVMRWQLRRATHGMILDIPPYTRSSNIQFSGSASTHWEDSIERTVRNVQRAMRAYLEEENDSPFAWWGVVQGETIAQMVEWHGRVSAVYPFTGWGAGEGWALAPKPSTSFQSTVRHLAFARDAGLRRVHLLQVTRPSLIGTALALCQMAGTFDLVTYDSATATRCAINRVALVPKSSGLGYTFIRQRYDTEGAVHDLIMGRPDDDAGDYYREAFPLTNKEWPHYVLLWNHKIMARTFENLYQQALADPEALLRKTAGRYYGQVLREWEGHHQPKPQVKKVGILERLRRKNG